MQRVAFTMKIKPGYEEEYRVRHQHVWPELLADLKKAGCHNYSIYPKGLDLFAYMEVEDFQRFLETMSKSETNDRWQRYMSEIMTTDPDPGTGFPYVLPEVFHLD